nr:phosphoglycerate mutase family protein [Myxococcus sp. MH1]
MRIYLARHGQSTWQVAPSTDWDTGLTDLGNEQSRRLAQWLASRPVVAEGTRLEVCSVWGSPLIRAQRTAALVAEALHLPLVTSPHLREAAFHVASQLPHRETPHEPFPSFEAPTEYAVFRQQARMILKELVEHSEITGGAVLAVSHGGLIKTMLRGATGSEHVCFNLYNTAVTVLEWRRGRWHLAHINLWDHLPPELRTI